MSGIYLIGEGGELVEMAKASYDSETVLQKLLAEHPSLLAGDQINSDAPRRWLLVSREIGVPSTEGGPAQWSLDHLFLDQDGVPTLVEVKRSTDTRIRREVVGQMLDYAANAVAYWPVEDLRNRFEAQCAADEKEPNTVLIDFLGDRFEVDEFWQEVETNLQIQKIRMIFIADVIPKELRRIVEFLNVQMKPAEVFALEVPQYVGGTFKSFVPRLIGQTVAAQEKKVSTVRRTGRQWDEISFFDMVKVKLGDKPEALVVRKIYDWMKKNLPIDEWGTGEIWGSYKAKIERKGVKIPLFDLTTGGFIQIPFRTFQTYEPFNTAANREQLRIKLNEAIPGLKLQQESINRYPNIRCSQLINPEVLNKFLEVMDWAVAQIKAG
jgi:hypothetical protein